MPKPAVVKTYLFSKKLSVNNGVPSCFALHQAKEKWQRASLLEFCGKPARRGLLFPYWIFVVGLRRATVNFYPDY
jgi:hypothetical protein